MRKWWVKGGESASGPWSAKALVKSVRAGALDRTALVRSSEDEPWAPLQSVPEISAALAAPPPSKRHPHAHGDRAHGERRAPAGGVFVAAVVLTSLAAASRVLKLVGAIVVGAALGWNDPLVITAVGLSALLVLAYGWALWVLVQRRPGGYKPALGLHVANALFALADLAASATYAEEHNRYMSSFSAAALFLAIGFSVAAAVVTYRARGVFELAAA